MNMNLTDVCSAVWCSKACQWDGNMSLHWVLKKSSPYLPLVKKGIWPDVCFSLSSPPAVSFLQICCSIFSSFPSRHSASASFFLCSPSAFISTVFLLLSFDSVFMLIFSFLFSTCISAPRHVSVFHSCVAHYLFSRLSIYCTIVHSWSNYILLPISVHISMCSSCSVCFTSFCDWLPVGVERRSSPGEL